MEKIKMFLSAHKVFKIFLWVFLILLILFIIIVIVRVVHFFDLDKTNAQVEKIHATKLTMDDVMGVNLPPDPGALADTTVEGVDVNKNGIRDDVEIAIFKEYPNSAKTRAVLLQYALALQMEVVQPFVNTTTVTEIVREEDRAYQCISEILFRDDDNENAMNKYFEDGDNLRSFVKNKQINTEERKKYRNNFYENVRSYNSLDHYCDIDYSKLSN